MQWQFGSGGSGGPPNIWNTTSADKVLPGQELPVGNKGDPGTKPTSLTSKNYWTEAKMNPEYISIRQSVIKI